MGARQRQGLGFHSSARGGAGSRAGRLFCGPGAQQPWGGQAQSTPACPRAALPTVLLAPLPPGKAVPPACLETGCRGTALSVCSAHAPGSDCWSCRCGCPLAPVRQRCVFALSGHCGWPPVWTSEEATPGLLALAVAFGGGVCSVLLPGGFPKWLCQLTPTGVPTALHSCQHCLTFNHCQSGGCEMVLWF